jgi:hypothetical protein
MRGKGIKENDGGVNSTMIYSKHVCKYHNGPLVQQIKKMRIKVTCVCFFLNLIGPKILLSYLMKILPPSQTY